MKRKHGIAAIVFGAVDKAFPPAAFAALLLRVGMPFCV